MSDCVLLLYWPDFCARNNPNPPVSPSLLAHALQRHLSTRYDSSAGYIWCPTPEEPDCAIFQRWGLRMLDRAPEAEQLISLAHGHPDKPHVILAMHPRRAAEALPELQTLGCYVQIWTPEPVGMAIEPGADPEEHTVRALQDALHLQTAHPVGLFADWHHLESGARRNGLQRGPEVLTRALLRSAGRLGDLVTARLYGPWEGGCLEVSGALPPAAAAFPSANGAAYGDEDPMRADLLRLLQAAEAPQTWVLVSGASWLPQVIGQAHACGRRVVLWPADEGLIPPVVRAEADSFETLAAVLQSQEIPTERGSAGRITQVTHASVRATVHSTRGEMPIADGVEAREAGPPSNPVALGARLGPWIRLMYHIECTLRRNGWSKIAFRKLAGTLSGLDEFGPTPTNALMWLNRAKAEGMLLTDQEAHRADPTLRVTICRPNLEHPVSRAAAEVPDRCLRLLRQMLQKMPWVSFKLLRSVLMREQWLGGPPYGLDETCIDEWLNFLVHDGAIAMTKEPNVENPEYPVTALRLNEHHPLSRSVVVEAAEGRRLAAERAILAIDHFLTRNRKPWMAMSALRRTLESMGRDELQAVLQGLQNLGALITESYPNPQKEHFTTGCRLKLDEPIVTDTLGTRNAIIRVTQYHQRYRNWVSLSKLEEDLHNEVRSPGALPDCAAWFLLLRDEGILELDHDAPPSNGWGGVRCRLNVTDTVVRNVVAEQLGEVA